MELIALILAAGAIWFFWQRENIAAGLSILTLAWCVQLILSWITVELVVR